VLQCSAQRRRTSTVDGRKPLARTLWLFHADRKIFPHWQRFERTAVAKAGKARTEVVWRNPACSAALIGQQAQQRLIA